MPSTKIVDEGQVVEGLARSDERESATRDAAKHLQETGVPRAINPNRAHHDDIEPCRTAELARGLLGFELGVLIDVTRIERRLFVRWWIGDVSMNSASAAMHDALNGGLT